MTKLSNLRSATTLPQLASVLGVKPSNLTYVLYWLQPDQKYKSFTLRKKHGGLRSISAPQPRLKFIQRRLASVLSDIQAELEERHKRQCILAHGFKKGFSIITNAKEHRNKRYVFNADLKDFFPSINFGRVYGFFTKDRNFALDPRVATVIAQIACFNNQLPQGSPCSPVISNLIAHVMDIHLNRIARYQRCTYTRYADDLTFSTNELKFPAAIARQRPGTNNWEAGDSLLRYVYRSGFKLNHEKTRLQLCDSRQDATGLIVNRKVNVRVEYYKAARAKCDHLFRHGYCYDKNNLVISEVALEGSMSFIFQIKRIKTESWWDEQKSFSNLYRKFLDYRTFHGSMQPRIICEGKTDNIFLRSAITNLRVKFPRLIGATGSPRVEFFNYNNATELFQDLSGGAEDLNKLLGKYRERMKPFAGAPLHPVIMVVDNDSGSKNLFAHLGKILGKKVDGSEPYYFTYLNLYVVPITKTGLSVAIEDLFDPKELTRKIEGRSLDRTNKERDGTKWYSKFEFATKIVRAERSTIDFSGFEPLLKAMSDMIVDFELRRAASIGSTSPHPAYV